MAAVSSKSNDKSEEVKKLQFPKVLDKLPLQSDQKKVKVPQYMLDLFEFVTNNKTGSNRTDISLPGSIVRSFYSEGKKTLNDF